jgi:hypothetical protein
MIPTVTRSRILFVWRVCANASPVSTKVTQKEVARMKMNVLMDTPTIVTKTPFAKTRKVATPAPVRMAIVI